MTGFVRSPRILVAEDSFLLADDLCDLLIDWGYAPVGPVARVSTAFQALSRGDFDFALMEIMLRDGNTFEFASDLTRKKLPFLFLTGVSRATLPARFRDAPVVHKPFEIMALESAVKALLAKEGSVGRSVTRRAPPYREDSNDFAKPVRPRTSSSPTSTNFKR